jgi:hypothetical protein
VARMREEVLRLRPGPVALPLDQRIAARTVLDEHECLVWQGAVDEKGYPRMCIGSMIDGSRRMIRVHRALWESSYGPVPAGFHRHHVCENKRCCNIDHLKLIAVSDHSRLHDTAALARAARAAGVHRPKPLGRNFCKACGGDISQKRADAKFCDRSCRDQYRRTAAGRG